LALTEREQDVAALVAKGLTNREVAAELYVSTKAVEYHLGNVFGKLGISSRRELRNRSAG
jgi:DNA-binding NarL/FixJ family response regulator